MDFTARHYAGDADLQRLRDLVVASVADAAHPCYWQLGDLIWGMYQNTLFDPTRHVTLWEDERGELLGFAWCERYGLSMQTHPRLRGADAPLLRAMIGWGEHHRAATATTDDERLLIASAFEDDAGRIALLAEHGFSADDERMLHMRRDLDQPIPAPSPPPGWSVRHVAGEQEFAERVAAHREVWHPSRVTLEAYQRMRTIAGYTPDLDLVAAAPDGTFGAYCICWHDPANRHGEFEPVGTRAAFRRLGLGRAVMLEGLRRLRERGVTTAIVYAFAANEAAWRLYESVGFRIVAVERFYSKRV